MVVLEDDAARTVLVSANIPKHPPLACQARIVGVVKLTFVLSGNAGEPTNVEAISGHPMLKDAALENVKTWKFKNSYAEGKYETTFDYRLPSSGPQKVTFESFHRVEVCESHARAYIKHIDEVQRGFLRDNPRQGFACQLDDLRLAGLRPPSESKYNSNCTVTSESGFPRRSTWLSRTPPISA